MDIFHLMELTPELDDLLRGAAMSRRREALLERLAPRYRAYSSTASWVHNMLANELLELEVSDDEMESYLLFIRGAMRAVGIMTEEDVRFVSRYLFFCLRHYEARDARALADQIATIAGARATTAEHLGAAEMDLWLENDFPGGNLRVALGLGREKPH